MDSKGDASLHWPIEDPAQATGSEEEITKVFRRVREEIRERVSEFIKEVGT